MPELTIAEIRRIRDQLAACPPVDYFVLGPTCPRCDGRSFLWERGGPIVCQHCSRPLLAPPAP